MFKGFSINQLKSAFDAIRDPDDWKEPIAAKMHGEFVLMAVAAIQFYTATTPQVQLDTRTMLYSVTSEGYRRGPAA